MTIRIRQYTFSILPRYHPGNVIDEAEAQVLQEAREEAIKQLAIRVVEDAVATNGGSILSQDQLEEVQEQITQLDREFLFTVRKRPPKVGTLEREARLLAIGLLPLDASDEEVAALAASDAIQAEARRNLAAKEEAALGTLADLVGE